MSFPPNGNNNFNGNQGALPAPGTAVFEGDTPNEVPGFKIIPIALMIVGGIMSLLGFFMLLPGVYATVKHDSKGAIL